MQTAKVFRSGNSQAVRLPKAFRLDADEVEIFREPVDYRLVHDVRFEYQQNIL